MHVCKEAKQRVGVECSGVDRKDKVDKFTGERTQ
jgi:hypothetical protein